MSRAEVAINRAKAGARREAHLSNALWARSNRRSARVFSVVCAAESALRRLCKRLVKIAGRKGADRVSNRALLRAVASVNPPPKRWLAASKR